jgi:hypothetical protein
MHTLALRRYVDAVKLVNTAETSGLKQVQIVKPQDWVGAAQQASADLEVRFATSLLALLRGDPTLSAANLARWANKAATKLAREFAVLKAEADTTREGQGGDGGDDGGDDGRPTKPTQARATTRGNGHSASGTATLMSNGLLSRSPSEQALMARELANGPGGDVDDLAKKQKPPGFCMANPTSGYRMGWDFALIMPCLAYLTIVMPFRMCLGNEPVPDTPVFYLEMAMDFVFILDIVVNFRTGFVDGATGLVV